MKINIFYHENKSKRLMEDDEDKGFQCAFCLPVESISIVLNVIACGISARESWGRSQLRRADWEREEL